jgi:hypothetical protein
LESSVLDALKAIHDDVLAQIDALEAVLSQPSPSRDTLTNARWRLMRASRNRLKLLDEQIYPALGDVLADRIEAFRADDVAKRAASAAHIARWHIAHIVADWSAYRKVSAAMTAEMRRRIIDEQKAFYPALRRRELIPSAGSPSGKSTRLPQDTPAEMPRSRRG